MTRLLIRVLQRTSAVINVAVHVRPSEIDFPREECEMMATSVPGIIAPVGRQEAVCARGRV